MSGLALTAGDAKRALEEAQRWRTRARRLEGAGEKLVERYGRTTVSGGTGFLLGVVQGAKFLKDGELFHVPLELGVGLLAHGLNLLGWAGKHSDIVSHVGDGALTSWLHVLGRGVGAQHWGGSGGRAATMGGDFANRLASIANSTAA